MEEIQAQDLERMVKCRVRSEVEQRKAAEAKMKRAMKEAFEVKKELSVLRDQVKEYQTKEQKTRQKTVTKRNQREKDNNEVEKSLRRELEEAKESLEESARKYEQQINDLEDKSKDAALKQQEYATLSKELETKLQRFQITYADEKRQLRKALKEKKERLEEAKVEKGKLLGKYHQLVDQAEKKKHDASVVASQKVQIRDLRAHVNDLEAKLQHTGNEYTEKILQLENRQKEREKEFKSERRQQTLKIQALQKKLKDLEEYKAKKESEVRPESELNQQEFERAKENVRVYEEKMKDLQDTIASLERALDQSSGQMAALRADFESEKQVRAAEEQAAEACERKMLRMESEIQDLTEKHARIENALEMKGIKMAFLLKIGASSEKTARDVPRNGKLRTRKKVSTDVNGQTFQSAVAKSSVRRTKGSQVKESGTKIKNPAARQSTSPSSSANTFLPQIDAHRNPSTNQFEGHESPSEMEDSRFE